MKLIPIQNLTEEPGEGSVLLSNGPEGTAWQRFVSDGLWHSVTGKVATWDKLRHASQARESMGMSSTLLIYRLDPIDQKS